MLRVRLSFQAGPKTTCSTAAAFSNQQAERNLQNIVSSLV